VTSRASAIASGAGRTGLAQIRRAGLLAGIGIGIGLAATALAGCGPEPVAARAIWIDDSQAGDGIQRIHVYDRGSIDAFELLGQREPVSRVRLDPRGAGILVRAGDRRGAWFDLDDGRRLPLLLPPAGFGSQPSVDFGPSALTWIDDADGAVTLVPLAPGVELERREDGSVIPLRRGAGFAWTRAAAQAPILFAAGLGGGRASFLRYPVTPEQAPGIVLEAEASGLALPANPSEVHACATTLSCSVQLAIEPEGELAIFAQDPAGPWQLFERRAAASAGPLILPETLAEAADGPGLRLLAVLDPEVSVWIGAGQLFELERGAGVVRNLPVFGSPPLHWSTADRGRAVILSSSAGPVYRADLTGLRTISVETSSCLVPSEPVVSPDGTWIAWTCVDPDAELVAASGVVVRVSAGGLERFVGVPMATLAIDDDGDLLVYSVQSSLVDQVDGVSPASVPRNLFTLARDGVLTRVDKLEPAPAPVLLGASERASYIQGVALAG
jgi:hypothetical protein